MNNKEYLVFEEPFRKLAWPILERLKDNLVQMGHGPFGDIFVTDHDIDRGLAFKVESPEQGASDNDAPVKLVEIILVDGAESGFDGVALRMECSLFFTGCVWQPGNYTENVSITNPDEIRNRLENLSQILSDVAVRIDFEWSRDIVEDNYSKPEF